MLTKINTFTKDIEDDVIDQGISSNIKESLDYYMLEEPTKLRTEPFLNEKIEEDYHNSYYIGGEHRTRSLRMPNKDWHKMIREQLNEIIDGN